MTWFAVALIGWGAYEFAKYVNVVRNWEYFHWFEIVETVLQTLAFAGLFYFLHVLDLFTDDLQDNIQQLLNLIVSLGSRKGII